MAFSAADSMAEALLPAVIEAARIEMSYFRGHIEIEKKADRSPVTIADREAEAAILLALETVAPGIPVVAEEAAAMGILPRAAERFFLVDALDGTRLFIRGKPEFSINIAIIEHGRPVFGMVFIPPMETLFVTRSDGRSYRAVVQLDQPADFAAIHFEPLSSRTCEPGNIVAFNSWSSGSDSTDYLKRYAVKEARPIGSSLKFCLIANGDGDLYARFGITYEWDTAAGQAVLEAAGGSVATLDGKPLTYGKDFDAYLNPHFVAWGREPPVIATVDTSP